MNELKAKEYQGVKVIDSRDVAVMVERSHNELMKSIRLYVGYLTEGDFAHGDFFIEHSYIDAKGGTRPCYLITKKGCDMIANKMTGKKGVLFTAAYVSAFEDMRNYISQSTVPIPNVMALAGMAQLVNANRRIMREQGSNPSDISRMAYQLETAFGIPLPNNFVREVPGQLTLFGREQLEIGGQVRE